MRIELPIYFHTESPLEFSLPDSEAHANWLADVAVSEKFEVQELNLIFCTDDYLLEVNKQYLDHDYYTDIITFDNSEGEEIIGDLFISVDRVKENAGDLSVGFDQELKRVMVHGLLHLLGYNDKTETEQLKIREKEDFYLQRFSG